MSIESQRPLEVWINNNKPSWKEGFANLWERLSEIRKAEKLDWDWSLEDNLKFKLAQVDSVPLEQWKTYNVDWTEVYSPNGNDADDIIYWLTWNNDNNSGESWNNSNSRWSWNDDWDKWVVYLGEDNASAEEMIRFLTWDD